MTFINIAAKFLVLFVFIKICETWSYQPILPGIYNRRRFSYEDLLPLFDDEGSIRFEGRPRWSLTYTFVIRIYELIYVLSLIFFHHRGNLVVGTVEPVISLGSGIL